MSEHMFGITKTKPTRAEAKIMNYICKEEGGHGFVEINVKQGTLLNVNHGQYQGWFTGPNRGNPFDQDLESKVLVRVAKEIK